MSVIVGKGDSRNKSEMGMTRLIMESLAKPSRRLIGVCVLVVGGGGVTGDGDDTTDHGVADKAEAKVDRCGCLCRHRRGLG